MLPPIVWKSEDLPEEPQQAVEGEELLVECWVVANEKGLSVSELEPVVVRKIAWHRYNDLGAPDTDRAGESTATRDDFSELIHRCGRTRELLEADWLTGDQESVLDGSSLEEIAASRACTRASACTLRKRASANLAKLCVLDELLFGNWPRWFERFASSWEAPHMRELVWPFVKPGFPSHAVRRILAARQKEMFELGIKLLTEQAGLTSTTIAEQIAQGYHLCVAATYAAPQTAGDAVIEMDENLAHRGLLNRKITDRCLHLLQVEEERERYLAMLQSYLNRMDAEAHFFSHYSAVYYGSAGFGDTRRYLRSHGEARVPLVNPDAAINETFANLKEPQYREVRTLDDINFVRCILLLRGNELRHRLGASSHYKLKTLAQHARKSRQASVSRLAQEVLNSLV